MTVGTSKRDTQGRKICEDIWCAKKKRDVMLQSYTLNINFIVYFICIQENVVLIDCTNVNYNVQPQLA